MKFVGETASLTTRLSSTALSRNRTWCVFCELCRRDSIINYETVKYFTNESYEVARVKQSVQEYQRFSVSTQASLSILNVSQQFIMYATLTLGTKCASCLLHVFLCRFLASVSAWCMIWYRMLCVHQARA